MCSEFILLPVHCQIRLEQRGVGYTCTGTECLVATPRSNVRATQVSAENYFLFLFVFFSWMILIQEPSRENPGIQQLIYLGVLECACTAHVYNQTASSPLLPGQSLKDAPQLPPAPVNPKGCCLLHCVRLTKLYIQFLLVQAGATGN